MCLAVVLKAIYKICLTASSGSKVCDGSSDSSSILKEAYCKKKQTSTIRARDEPRLFSVLLG